MPGTPPDEATLRALLPADRDAATVDLPCALQPRDNEFTLLSFGDFTEPYPSRFQYEAYCPFAASV